MPELTKIYLLMKSSTALSEHAVKNEGSGGGGGCGGGERDKEGVGRSCLVVDDTPLGGGCDKAREVGGGVRVHQLY